MGVVRATPLLLATPLPVSSGICLSRAAGSNNRSLGRARHGSKHRNQRLWPTQMPEARLARYRRWTRRKRRRTCSVGRSRQAKLRDRDSSSRNNFSCPISLRTPLRPPRPSFSSYRLLLRPSFSVFRDHANPSPRPSLVLGDLPLRVPDPRSYRLSSTLRILGPIRACLSRARRGPKRLAGRQQSSLRYSSDVQPGQFDVPTTAPDRRTFSQPCSVATIIPAARACARLPTAPPLPLTASTEEEMSMRTRADHPQVLMARPR